CCPVAGQGGGAKSVGFGNMDGTEFQQVDKSVLNGLWNWNLYRKCCAQEQVENVSAQLQEFA
ncbi:DUF1367 family protein, partial [Escherichia coli]